MTDYLTGDKVTDAVLPAAQRLILAAHAGDHLGVDTAFADAELAVGDPTTAAKALAVVLAAMCPDDTSPVDALAWRRNPAEYRRLRRVGVSSREAGLLAATVAANLRKGVA